MGNVTFVFLYSARWIRMTKIVILINLWMGTYSDSQYLGCNLLENKKTNALMLQQILWFSIVILDCSLQVLVKTFPLLLTDEEGSDQHPSLWHAAHSGRRQSQRLAPAEECWHICPPTVILSLCGGGQGRIHFLTSRTAGWLNGYFTQNENYVIKYSPWCRSKPVRPPFIVGTMIRSSSYGFGTTSGWVLNDIIFILVWTNPLTVTLRWTSGGRRDD